MSQPSNDALVHAAGGGGFGGPPAGGYGPPPGGFGGPPAGGFGGPPAGGFGAPPGGFGAAPGGYGVPPAGPYGPSGPYGPPAPYGSPGPYGSPPQELQQRVERWFILSIVSLFCGCGVLGIIPILIANNAKDALRQGNYAKAESDIGTAKLLCILGYVAIGLVLLFYLVYFVIILGVLATMR
jgi:hypothetical protein